MKIPSNVSTTDGEDSLVFIFILLFRKRSPLCLLGGNPRAYMLFFDGLINLEDAYCGR